MLFIENGEFLIEIHFVGVEHRMKWLANVENASMQHKTEMNFIF